jgi:hypothetical protein
MLSVQPGPDEVGPGIARFDTRYEDLTQDGHAKLTALPAALGRACFAELWPRHPLAQLQNEGVRPILSRLAIEVEPAAARLLGAFEGRGLLRLAHERDAQDQVQAIFLNAEASVWALARRSREMEPKAVRIGRVFARPHADRASRKVLAFDVPGYPNLPSLRYARPKLDETARVNAKARALEPDFSPDIAPWAFGLTHTDGNRHVNSLVYVRLFEDAALRRLAMLGRSTCVLAREVEINYRKPCFAGDQLACMLQAHATREGDVVVGYIAEPGEPLTRARCAVRMHFSPPSGASEAQHAS